MGSGAKIALVAFLIIMVVVVAKFVQNDSAPPEVDPSNQATASGKETEAKKANPAGRTTHLNPGRQTRPADRTRKPRSSEPRVAPRRKVDPAPVRFAPSTATNGVTPPASSKRVGGLPLESGTDRRGPYTGYDPFSPRILPADTTRPKPSPEDNLKGDVRRPPVGTGGSGSGSTPGTPGSRDNKSIGNTGTGPGRFGTALNKEPNPVPNEPRTLPEPSPPPAPAKPKFPIVHDVVENDSYWGLAQKYYGDGTLLKVIQDANNGVMPIAGKKLKIPAPPKGSVTRSTRRTSGSQNAGTSLSRSGESRSGARNRNPIEYVVQKGDTLSKIAVKYSSTLESIYKANPGTRYLTLRTGQRIRIPKR